MKKIELDNADLKNSGFWLSQIFVMISTIVGVYLAAQSGLTQALLFDEYAHKEDNYYLRTSLYDEVNDNMLQVEHFATEFLLKNKALQLLKDNRPVMDKYIWTTMQYNPTTLETPSSILSDVRRFYTATNSFLNRAEKRSLGASYAGEQILVLVERIKTNTLPSLQKSAQKLKDELAEEGIDIGSLKEI